MVLEQKKQSKEQTDPKEESQTRMGLCNSLRGKKSKIEDVFCSFACYPSSGAQLNALWTR